ncbi:MAG: pitrilysin family protein [Bacteroidota bacterium]
MLNQRAKILLFLLLIQGLAAWGQPTERISIDWAAPFPQDTSVRQGILSNGLQYFIRYNNEPRDRAEFRLAVKAGSLQEEDDQLGVAHFVEHMAFNGTRHFEKNTLVDFMERNGSGFGADLNAYTSFDRTVYKLKIQTDTQTVVDTALQILVDWAGGLSFDPEEVEKERGIIRSEWRSRLDSRQRLEDQSYAVLFPNSRYLARFPIGDPVLIDTVSAQRLADFHQRWYQPKNMAIIAVGNFSVDDMEAAIKAKFSELKNRDFVPTKNYALDTSSRQSFLLATDDEAAFTRWEVNFQLDPLKKRGTLGDLRQQLVYRLYNSLLGKRFAAIREQEVPPYTFAGANYSNLLYKYRSYRLSAMVEPDQVLAALERVLLEPQRASLHGFNEAAKT